MENIQMSLTTSFFIRIIETAKIFKKEPFWGQALQLLWDHVGQNKDFLLELFSQNNRDAY